jgi:hypothetical protein
MASGGGSRSTRAGEPRDHRQRRQAVEDVAAGDLLGRAQRGQVDVLVPGQQQPQVSLDRGSGGTAELELERAQAVIDDGPDLGRCGGQLLGVVRQRRTICRRRGLGRPRERGRTGAGRVPGTMLPCLARAPLPAWRFWHRDLSVFPHPSDCQDRISPAAGGGEVTVLGLGLPSPACAAVLQGR